MLARSKVAQTAWVRVLVKMVRLLSEEEAKSGTPPWCSELLGRLPGSQTKPVLSGTGRPKPAAPETSAKSAEVVIAVNGQNGTVRRTHDLEAFVFRKVDVFLPIPLNFVPADRIDERSTGVDGPAVHQRRIDGKYRNAALLHPTAPVPGHLAAIAPLLARI